MVLRFLNFENYHRGNVLLLVDICAVHWDVFSSFERCVWPQNITFAKSLNVNTTLNIGNCDSKSCLHHVKQFDWHGLRQTWECVQIKFELPTNKTLTGFYCQSVNSVGANSSCRLGYNFQNAYIYWAKFITRLRFILIISLISSMY